MVRIAEAQSPSLQISRGIQTGLLTRLLNPQRCRGMLAMADQGIASLGNFTTNILLARALSREDYGTFGLILEAVLFFNAIQAALVTYPLSVKGATADATRLGRFTTTSLVLTGLFGLLISGATFVVGAMHGQLRLAACASAALLLWQTQETLRRAMISQLQYSRVMIGDAISYLGQGVVIGMLVWCGTATIERVFIAIAVTSAAGAIVQLRQVRPRAIALRQLIRSGIEFVIYGRWQALNNAAIIVTAMGYSWALAYFHGAAAVAELYAIAILLKLANPLTIGIGGLIVAASARAHASGGANEAWHVASRYAWIGAAVLVPYFVLLICYPTFSIRLVHGAESVYTGRTDLLRLLVAWAALTYTASTISAYLGAVHESGRSLRAQLTSVCVSLVVGIPLMIFGGVVAGAAGLVTSVAAQLVMLVRYQKQVRSRARRQQLERRLDALIAARLEHEPDPVPVRLVATRQSHLVRAAA